MNNIPIIRGFAEIKNVYNFAIKHDLIICGGYPRYCASPKQKPIPAGDIDLFPKDVIAFDSAKKDLELLGLEIKNENDVSLSFKKVEDITHGFYYAPKIQLIKPVMLGAILTSGGVEDIINNFDFTVVRVAIINENECIADDNFLEDEKNTLLRFKNIHCPVSSMFRAIKYIKKGYFLKPTEAIKLFKDWDSRTTEYRSKIIDYFDKVEEYEKTGVETLTEQELFEFERLMMLD